MVPFLMNIKILNLMRAFNSINEKYVYSDTGRTVDEWLILYGFQSGPLKHKHPIIKLWFPNLPLIDNIKTRESENQESQKVADNSK